MQKLLSQRGIALIQVLIISAILSTMLLYIAAETKRQVKLAEELQAKSMALLQLQNAEAEFLFSSLTSLLIQQPSAKTELPKIWNFFNEPIQMTDGTAIQIQDLAGLLSIYHSQQLKFYLTSIGLAEESATKVVAEINQGLQPDSNIPSYLNAHINSKSVVVKRYSGIQLTHELLFIPGITPELWRSLSPLLTTYPAKVVNLLNMPAELLGFYMHGTSLQSVLQNRKIGVLNPKTYHTYIAPGLVENYSTTPGDALRVRFTAQVKDVILQREFVVVLKPRSVIPFTYWEYYKYRHDD